MRLYSDSNVLVMELKNRVPQTSPVTIQDVTTANVDDALNFQSSGQVKTFRSFLKQGHKGFYGYLINKCVHRSWVVVGPGKAFIHKFYSIILKENEVFIQYCETASEARGKNIFAHVLSHIGQQFPTSRVLTSVDQENHSSIKSMLKAGFVQFDLKRIKMIFGIRSIS